MRRPGCDGKLQRRLPVPCNGSRCLGGLVVSQFGHFWSLWAEGTSIDTPSADDAAILSQSAPGWLDARPSLSAVGAGLGGLIMLDALMLLFQVAS